MSDNSTCDLNSSCAGKQAFKTAGAAAKAKGRLGNRHNAKRHQGLVVYRCNHCHCYHLGGALKHNIKGIRAEAKRFFAKGHSSRA